MDTLIDNEPTDYDLLIEFLEQAKIDYRVTNGLGENIVDVESIVQFIFSNEWEYLEVRSLED